MRHKVFLVVGVFFILASKVFANDKYGIAMAACDLQYDAIVYRTLPLFIPFKYRYGHIEWETTDNHIAWGSDVFKQGDSTFVQSCKYRLAAACEARKFMNKGTIVNFFQTSLQDQNLTLNDGARKFIDSKHYSGIREPIVCLELDQEVSEEMLNYGVGYETVQQFQNDWPDIEIPEELKRLSGELVNTLHIQQSITQELSNNFFLFPGQAVPGFLSQQPQSLGLQTQSHRNRGQNSQAIGWMIKLLLASPATTTNALPLIIFDRNTIELNLSTDPNDFPGGAFIENNADYYKYENEGFYHFKNPELDAVMNVDDKLNWFYSIDGQCALGKAKLKSSDNPQKKSIVLYDINTVSCS